MAHTVEIIARHQSNYTYRCRCGDSNVEGYLHRDMAEDAAAKHLAEVERRALAMRGGSQTLEAAHKYYAEQAQNPEVSEQDRTLWALLEKQTGTRLGLYSPPSEQLGLFPQGNDKGRSNRT